MNHVMCFRRNVLWESLEDLCAFQPQELLYKLSSSLVCFPEKSPSGVVLGVQDLWAMAAELKMSEWLNRFSIFSRQ